MINFSRIYESVITEGKHWPEDYIKAGFNMIKSSDLGQQSWYSDNFIRQDLKTIADEFGPLSHKNSNLGYFSPIVRWFIEYSGKDKQKYQEFIERKLDKVIQGLQLIVNDSSLESKWKDKIKKDLPFKEFEKIIDSELEKVSQDDASKRGKTYGKSDYEIIPIDSYEELHERFGGDRTGYKGQSEWCHTNGKSTYESWTSNGTKAFFVLARKDWEKIDPPDPKETNAYDQYGTSLIAILVEVSSNDLLNATLRWNHVIEPSETKPKTTVDKAFFGWGDLNETVGMDVEKEVEKILGKRKLDLQKKISEVNERVKKILADKTIIDKNTIPNEYRRLITEINIPDSVKNIGSYAFYGCNFTSVTIPSSVTSIGYSAFMYCKKLITIMIPNSVTSIGDFAFDSCDNLISVSIPDSVTRIGNWVFSDCSSLTSVTILNGVTSIGEGAFNGCSGLTSITIPDSVTRIRESVFGDCKNLTITFAKGFDKSILNKESFDPSCKFIFEE